ncbi:hypothetical protein [Rhizobium rhizogenes]|uniref:DUF4815 domain-containing protein n=1 Tax=Rhizobium rhizogenes TaxID=359 RepID=A0AA92HAA3_RHIRH|nr:hypothetical protein [Rhizobium rhizogenes]PVE56299.1 hypothetical protein DC430_00345 [Rhizobium rhizogenes]PVE64794.1 hypothetical protein DC415_13545 [Agrobacterium tumefaciens]PVE73932.1 hypothetical protein DCP16_13545 [Sphingomonas sp. TPD3009]
MKRTSFAEAEIADHADFERIGLQAQAATDRVWGDAIGYPAHWAAFTVSRKSAQTVTVAPGRYVAGEVVYDHAEPKDLNLQLNIPAAASDQRWVAILLRGEEVTETANRPFETSTDPETSVIVNRTTPKTISRIVKLIVQSGEANPVPAKPAVDPTDACIAYVLLKSTGIDAIEPGNSDRVKTLYEVEGRVTALEVDLDSLFLRTSTIETQITNIVGRLGEVPRPEIIRQMQRDVGAARLQLNLPDEARAYRFDPGLTLDQWDNTHVDWLARINEGVRFPFAATTEARLEVQAEDDPNIMFRGRRMVPAFDEVTRIANTSQDATLNISQLVHTQITAVLKDISRTRIIYGPTQEVCENNSYWAGVVSGARVGMTFAIGGETFEVVAEYGGRGGHRRYGVRTIRRETYTESYWDYVSEEVGLNGSIYAQTFLVAQPMQMTSLELAFARVGNDGDVHVLITETTPAGTPKFDSVLARGTLKHADMVVGWNKIVLPITLLESGARYAFVTVTTGAHAVQVSGANKFTGGSQFLCTDGAFAQGSTEIDFCFRVNAARFRSPRTVIPMHALTQQNGMTEIDMLFAGWAPAGCALAFEIRPAGQTAWTELDDGDPALNPLVGLPASVELRMVMMGTADLQPMIQLDAKAISRVSRNRGDMKGVSKEFDFGISTSAIVTQFTVDRFDPARHTFSPAIMVGNNVIAPTTTTVTIDPNEPKRRTFLSTYSLGAATQKARLRPAATTNNVVSVPFVQDAYIAAL